MKTINLIKRSSKRAIAIVIAFNIVLSVLLINVSVLAASSLQYEKGGVELWTNTTEGNNLYNSIKDDLPKMPGNVTPPTNIRGYPLNFRLWLQKGLLVYGTFNSVRDKNQFKLGTQSSPGIVNGNDGYYYGTDSHTGQSGRGEWRYHGIDASGNLFSNMNFIDDGSNTKFNEREWVKEPWTFLPLSKRPNISSYNFTALNLGGNASIEIQSALQQWINKSLPDGVPLKSKPVDPETYKYLNILSAPTSMQPGQGRMWHEKDDGSIWYQTLSVPRLTAKQNLPVSATITPLTALTINDPGTDKDNQQVLLKFMVTSTLNDIAEYTDPVKKTIYYTRDDIESWKLTFTSPSGAGNITQTQTGVPKVNNAGSYTFTINTTYGYLRSKNWSLYLTATGQPLHKNDTLGNTGNASYLYVIGVQLPPLPEPDAELINFTPEPNIPEIAFDCVPFSATDNTDMSNVNDRRVYINGGIANDNIFFSSSYLFNVGDVGVNGKFAFVDVEYDVENAPPGERLGTHDVVYVYPTKPIANFKISSNTWKQNRIIKVQDTSSEGNIQLVVEKYPIVQYEWTFGGDASQIKFGTDTPTLKEFICKTPGIYSVTLRCRNTLGKWSDPYTVQFEVLEDVAPAIGLNLTDSTTARNEAISAWYYDVSSTDGDVIKASSIELWYDADNNGSLETRLNTWDGSGQFPVYTPTKLGYYKYIVKAQEDITSDTFSQFITEADKKTSRYEVEWWVDNYRPMSDLFINLPIQRPNIDVYFMLDKNLSQSKTDYILSSKMNISNWLIGKNIIPNVEIWDMKTYTYSQPASTSNHTGSSYPPSTTSYSSNGYSGTLNRTSVSNNDYSRDEGHYSTQTESRTFSRTVTNSRSWSKNQWGIAYGSWSHSDYGSSYSINEDGYSGSIPSTGVSYSPSDFSGYTIGASGTQTATKTFSGTLTKQVQVWIPNIVWYNDYTGYYSGSIYKDVRQPYTDPFNSTSIKYVVYISESTISELPDFQMVMGHAPTAKLLLAGTSEIVSQVANEEKYFNASGKTIDTLANEILEYISVSSPSIEKYYVLQNQAFTLNTGNLDLEGDTITIQQMQYVSKPSYFNNPTGTEPGTVAAYSDTSGWTSAIKGSFANTGLYEIYRRIKDNPTADPNFSQYSYYSGSTMFEIYVHRKPLALAVLDWDFDAASGVYITSWVDNSYDPDHQYNRQDRGIVERNTMWRPSGGMWNYGIPDRLAPGTYELQYFVKDPEGVWSDPYIMNFTLSSAPSMQFDAKLRTLDSSFSLNSIPASESLEAYDVWTRYPYNVQLQMTLYNGTSMVSPAKTVQYSTSTGTRNGNDIAWNNIPYPIASTVPDGNYTFRITAIGEYGKSAVKEFPVRVETPINLVAMINGVSNNAKIESDMESTFTFKTSKYVSSVQLVFKGKTYSSNTGAISLASNDGIRKTWEMKTVVPDNTVTDGETGYATFTAFIPSGKSQAVNVDYYIIAVRAYDFTITSILDINWRAFYFDLSKPINGDAEKYGYTKRSNTDIKTTVMPVNSLSLIPFSNDSVQAGCKVKGYIRVKGSPQSVSLIARYVKGGVVKQSSISPNYVSGDKYDFEWIIPQDTDQESYVRFDVDIRKGGKVYGSEKWYDSWPAGNNSRSVFYVKGNVMDDIIFNQSH